MNFHENYRQFNVDDNLQDPQVLAETYTSSEFPSGDSVINATRAFLAQELSTDRLVRSTLRQFAERTATVSVFCTERGKAEIDESHEYYVSA